MMVFATLMNIKGIGKKRYQKIVNIMQKKDIQLKDLYAMSPDMIKATFSIPINVAKEISQSSNQVQVITNPQKSSMPGVDSPLTKKDILELHKTDQNYPVKLIALLGESAPDVLYVWGNLDLLHQPSVGFCGSRNVTDKGLDITADITKQISKMNWVTVSGHARGVDTKAHRTALENDGGTIIVLPQGLAGFKLRTELRQHIRRDNVLILSEFQVDAGWTVGRAMQRNSTIIGLSDAMVLVESRDKGGTFSAGKTALKYKHPLFVVDFKETANSNAGNKYFIQKGAIKIGKNPVTHQANIKPLQDKVTSNLHSGLPSSQPATQLLLFES